MVDTRSEDIMQIRTEEVASDSERIPLINSPKTEYISYRQRWFILAAFSILNITQSGVYNTFGPISSSSVAAFGLSQTDVALLPNWANIIYFLSIGPFVYLIDVKGLRMPVVLTAAFIWAGCASRILHIGNNYRMFLHLGQILNSFAGPVTWFACSNVASTWFPPSERVLATGVSLLTGNIGLSCSFIFGPLVVKAVSHGYSDAESLRRGILTLLSIEFIFASIVLVVIIYTFSSKPPTPPSYSASTNRMPLKEAIFSVLANKDCMVAVSIYAFTSGMWGGWVAVLSWAVRRTIDEVEAGWIGLAATMAGAAAGMLASAFGNRLKGHEKKVVVLSNLLSALFITWHVVTYNYATSFYSNFGLWICVVGVTAALSTSGPFLWELCCDSSYPAPEAVVSALLSLGNSIVSAVLLVILMEPSYGTEWMDWSVVACFWFFTPVTFLYQPTQRRSAADTFTSIG